MLRSIDHPSMEKDAGSILSRRVFCSTGLAGLLESQISLTSEHASPTPAQMRGRTIARLPLGCLGDTAEQRLATAGAVGDPVGAIKLQSRASEMLELIDKDDARPRRGSRNSVRQVGIAAIESSLIGAPGPPLDGCYKWVVDGWLVMGQPVSARVSTEQGGVSSAAFEGVWADCWGEGQAGMML